MRRAAWAGSAGVALLALALYLPGFWWGAPAATSALDVRSWGTDDESPLGPLAEIHNILEPKADRNLGYPLLLSFVLAAAQAPYLGWLWLSGGLGDLSADYPYGFADAVAALRTLTSIAHLVAVLFGVGVVVFANLTARVLWGRRAGLLAALLVGSSFPMFYYARNANVDVPMLCFVAGAAWIGARCVMDGVDRRLAVALGGFVGAALATKEMALGAFLPLPLLFLRGARRSPAATWKHASSALLAALAVFGVGSGLFVEPDRYWAHVAFITGRVAEVARESSPLLNSSPYTWSGHVSHLGLLARFTVEGTTIAGLVLGVWGLGFGLRRRRPEVLIALMGLSYFAFVFFVVRVGQLRYMMPTHFAILVVAAGGTSMLFDNQRRSVRVAALALIVAAVGLGLLRGASLTHEMIADSRYAAERWLAEHARSGDRIDFFGPRSKLPGAPPGVVFEAGTSYDGIWKLHGDPEATAAQVRERWRTRPPRYILLIPDVSSRPGRDYNLSCPEAVCAALIAGDPAYPQVAMFHTRPIFAWMPRPALDYPTVNPAIRVFEPAARENARSEVSDD